jgi:hypothetical protein
MSASGFSWPTRPELATIAPRTCARGQMRIRLGAYRATGRDEAGCLCPKRISAKRLASDYGTILPPELVALLWLFFAAIPKILDR